MSGIWELQHSGTTETNFPSICLTLAGAEVTFFLAILPSRWLQSRNFHPLQLAELRVRNVIPM